jgi:hypothetical protein
MGGTAKSLLKYICILTYAGLALWDDHVFGNVNTNSSCEIKAIIARKLARTHEKEENASAPRKDDSSEKGGSPDTG